MSHSKTRSTHKVVISDVSLSRLRPRLSEEPIPPVSDMESTFTSSPNSHKPSRARLVRPKPQEVLATSPYAGSAPQQLPRSLSVTKASKSAAEKQATPVKERPIGGLSSVQSEAFFAKLRLPHPDVSRRKPTKEGLNATTIAREDLSSTVNFSFNTTFTPHSESPRTQAVHSATDLKSIESKLQRALRDLGKESNSSREIDLYSQAFQEAIELNPACKSLLSKIKNKYESWLRLVTERERRATDQYKSDIIHLQNSLLQAMEEKSELGKKVERVAQENAELVRVRESYQRKCSQYQEKLYEVANTKLDGFPPTEDAWKLLTSELISYKSWKKKVLKELKTTQSKEKALSELVQAMKKRGYPIDEVYNSDVKPKRHTFSTRSEESSDSEPIPPVPVRPITKADAVPQLRLEEVERDISSASVSEISTESYEASVRKTPGQRSGDRGSHPGSVKAANKVVPQLVIPRNAIESAGFHQEFMAKYEEFSESWRQQIDAQKH